MSVSTILDVEKIAYKAQSLRCYDLHVDGQIYSANGDSGTFLIGTLGLTGAYADDGYSAAITNLAYTKFAYSVNLQMKQFLHTVVGSGGVFTFSTLPAALRPASTQRYLVVGRNGGTNGICTLEIAPSGVITLYSGSTPTTFATGSSGLPNNTSVTYNIN